MMNQTDILNILGYLKTIRSAADACDLPTLNLEYDGDFDLEPQAAYDACKAGTCLGHVWDMRHGTLWSCVDRYGLMNNMYLSGIFPGHESLDIMSHLICDFCVLSE